MNTQTEVKQTPGPWHVGMKPGPILYGTKGEQIADLRGHWLEDSEHMADVRLIAAAPELLEALKVAQKALEYWGDKAETYQKANDPVRLEAHHLISGAIAKAEGHI